MRASSQAALRAGAERWEPVLREVGEDARGFGEQLYGVADTLHGSGSLRRALTDPSRDGEDKAKLARAVFAPHAASQVVDLIAGLVRSRWSQDDDLAEAVEELATTSILAAAQSREKLLQVEEELFLVERLLADNRELRRRLTDAEVPVADRLAVVEKLLGSRVEVETRILFDRLVATASAGTLSAGLTRIGRLAASRRDRLVASVIAAAPLSRSQEERLANILQRQYGRPVHVNVALDPEIIGGLQVQIGADVIDGTMLTRLNDARRRFHG
ncbi:MAG TPA: F0F1 ATP synthase subunit delta [Actinomycetaceae bacterium]|nr:F0F1 ATP synthase subunit delta [Actinomycetaceae bacterium]